MKDADVATVEVVDATTVVVDAVTADVADSAVVMASLEVATAVVFGSY